MSDESIPMEEGDNELADTGSLRDSSRHLVLPPSACATSRFGACARSVPLQLDLGQTENMQFFSFALNSDVCKELAQSSDGHAL